MKRLSTVLLTPLLLTGCSSSPPKMDAHPLPDSHKSAYRMMDVKDVRWEKLNPARGNQSPQAATLWGNRQGSVATGFLVKFVDGFSSPPHIHNVTYRGVVIEGLVHNDDPKAEPMWMPAGSFWTQPKGEVHITAAKGKTNIAYIEIDSGPYRVLPPKKAFDSGERPINMDPSNIVWTRPPHLLKNLKRSEENNKAHIAYLWGQPGGEKPYGTMVRLESGFSGYLESQGQSLRATLVAGTLKYRTKKAGPSTTLLPGSHFSSHGTAIHRIATGSAEQTTLYLRATGPIRLVTESE